MKSIKLPNGIGTVIVNGTDAENTEVERVIHARHAFATSYCTEKGWPTDATKLSIDQIMEIRAQPGWKTP